MRWRLGLKPRFLPQDPEQRHLTDELHNTSDQPRQQCLVQMLPFWWLSELCPSKSDGNPMSFLKALKALITDSTELLAGGPDCESKGHRMSFSRH
jgi:hypothetical protein